MLIENFKISKSILDIFSESLSSHIKSENYNTDYNSKDLITFCKCKAYKIYKNYFCKIYLLHFVKIYLLLESNILFKPWSILKFLFRISRNQMKLWSFLWKVFSQKKFKSNTIDFKTQKYNKDTSQECIKILLAKNLSVALYKNIFICWMWYILRVPVFANFIVLFVKILKFSIDLINKKIISKYLNNEVIENLKK